MSSAAERNSYLSLAAAMLLGAAARLYRLGHESLWLDEASSADVIARPLMQVAAVDISHPPLYHLLLHLWSGLGTDEVTLRGLSVLFSLATIPIVYAIGRRVGGSSEGPRLGALAALLFALAPFQVRYAQEARMYSLLTFCVAIAIWGWVTVIRGERNRAGWAAYVIGAAAAMWTQYLGVLFVLAANIGVVTLLAMGAIRRRPFLGPWLSAQGVLLLLWLPLAPRFLAMMNRVTESFWIPEISLQRIKEAFSAVFLANYADPGASHLGLVLLIAAAAGAWAWRGKRVALALCAVLIAVPWLVEIASGLFRSILLDRTLIWTAVPFQLLVAAGVLAPRRFAARALAVGAVVAIVGVDLLAFHSVDRKPPWRRVAAEAALSVQPADVLVFVPEWFELPFDYYFRASSLDIDRAGSHRPYPPRMTPTAVESITERVASYDRVWVVTSLKHARVQDPEGLLLTALGERCQAGTQTPYGEIRVFVLSDCR